MSYYCLLWAQPGGGEGGGGDELQPGHGWTRFSTGKGEGHPSLPGSDPELIVTNYNKKKILYA